MIEDLAPSKNRLDGSRQTNLSCGVAVLRFPMIFCLQLQILVGITVPPILTAVCWLIGRRVARSSGGAAGSQGRTGFWSMLIAAYVIFALALAGSQFLATHERADPTSLLVQ